MTKRKDPDLIILGKMEKLTQKCSCLRMVKANLEYLCDKYITHGDKNYKSSKNAGGIK